MPAMIGWTLRSAVVRGLLVGLCLCEPLAAHPHSPASKPPQNQTEAPDVEAVRLVAEQGDAEAQYNLGGAYASGQGVPQDYTETARWFRRAAEQGHANAQYALGLM